MFGGRRDARPLGLVCAKFKPSANSILFKFHFHGSKQVNFTAFRLPTSAVFVFGHGENIMPRDLSPTIESAKSAEVFTVEEVATQLRVHKLTVYRAIKSGKLEAQRVGKLIRITDEALADFTAGKSQ